ncbi:MAG TPA: CehA/McbA family metallohydrolase [Cyclobacteriaceae bacterium]|nr:CehA/McbA family metallohydrolase [Cyclobacteriaceae bacterium]
MKNLSLVFCLLFVSVVLKGQQYKYYAGNIHAHTRYSDGNQDWKKTKIETPAGSYAYAKKSDHFDFLGISEHNHSEARMKRERYAKGLDEAEKSTTSKFLCMYGMEYGVIKKGGHVLIYGYDKLLGWEDGNCDVKLGQYDYNKLWQILSEDHNPVFATLAHPKTSDYQGLISKPYNKTADDVICGVAVMTGPAKAKKQDYSTKASGTFVGYYKKLLAKGYHVGPTVDHDNHNLTFGSVAHSRTIVLAKKLDLESVMDAYQQMRFFASEDWNAKVDFTINGKPMGEMFNTRTDANISVKVMDDDASDKVASIKVMYGKPGSQTLARQLTTTTDDTLTFTQPQSDGEEFYYYLEITQKDKDRIYTAPIWVRRVK